MSVVSNFVGELSASHFGGKQGNVNSNIDLNDNTFANILDKQLNNSLDKNTQYINQLDMSYIPSGIDIGDFDGRIPKYDLNDVVNSTNNKSKYNNHIDNVRELSTSEILTFLPSIFDSKPSLTQTTSNGLFDFERRFAANSYGKYAKNIVTNLGEFVSDAINVR